MGRDLTSRSSRAGGPSGAPRPRRRGTAHCRSTHCEPAHSAPLSQLVYERTAGNPFFLIQFFRALAEEGSLTFEHERARWSWNLDCIRTKGYTDNVVDLMVGKLRHLPVEVQNALRQLACLGTSADVTMLSLVLGTSEEQVHADLWEAVRQEFVERSAGAYRFIHDRVQEAAHSLIPEDWRAEAHLRIGRLLVAQTPRQKQEEAIIEIVNQLNRGEALITAQDEREQLAELNLVAGKRAKASNAYAAAQTYITAGCALLPEDCWEHCFTLPFSLEFHLAECELLNGALAAAEDRLACGPLAPSGSRNPPPLPACACRSTPPWTGATAPSRYVSIIYATSASSGRSTPRMTRYAWNTSGSGSRSGAVQLRSSPTCPPDDRFEVPRNRRCACGGLNASVVHRLEPPLPCRQSHGQPQSGAWQQ
jgi:hypothetical protein